MEQKQGDAPALAVNNPIIVPSAPTAVANDLAAPPPLPAVANDPATLSPLLVTQSPQLAGRPFNSPRPQFACGAGSSLPRQIHRSQLAYLLGNFQVKLGRSEDYPEFKFLPPLLFYTRFGPRTWEFRQHNRSWLVQLERIDGKWVFSTGFKDFLVANDFERGTVLDFDVFEQHSGRLYMKVSEW